MGGSLAGVEEVQWSKKPRRLTGEFGLVGWQGAFHAIQPDLGFTFWLPMSTGLCHTLVTGFRGSSPGRSFVSLVSMYTRLHYDRFPRRPAPGGPQ